ncbi:MAG: RIP metalloprotease RseP [Devosia sp.]
MRHSSFSRSAPGTLASLTPLWASSTGDAHGNASRSSSSNPIAAAIDVYQPPFLTGDSALSFLGLPVLLAIPAFIVMITIIVFVHEMGHYWVARWNGIAIQTFSIGFGRELWGFTDRDGTRWRVSAIPLGGYVRFVGDMNAASMPDPAAVADLPPEIQPRLFVNKNVWQRIAVVAAGPLANLLFTFLVLYALLVGYGRYTIEPVIGTVVESGVADVAGLEVGDTIVSVDGFKVRGFEDFQRLIATAPGRPVNIVLDRNGQVLSVVLTPEVAESTDRFGNTHRVGRIGVSRDVAEGDVVLYRPSAGEAVGMTFEEMQFIVARTAAFIGDFFVGRGDVEQLGGPIKVARVSGEVATLGVLALINLAALLSINIGIFNLLPIPVLDGGHLVYYFIEALRGRPLSLKAQEIGYRLGFAVVGSLMIFTLFNDTILEALRRLT